jgi:hypothetical protein
MLIRMSEYGSERNWGRLWALIGQGVHRRQLKRENCGARAQPSCGSHWSLLCPAPRGNVGVDGSVTRARTLLNITFNGLEAHQSGDEPLERFDLDNSGSHFDRPVVDDERGGSVAGTGLKWARTAVRILDWRFFGSVRRMCSVSVEHEVSDVFGHLTRTGRDRVRKQNRDAWNEPIHTPNVALLTKNANRDPGVSC